MAAYEPIERLQRLGQGLTGVGGGLGSSIELAGVEVWLLAVLWCIGLVLGESVG